MTSIFTASIVINISSTCLWLSNSKPCSQLLLTGVKKTITNYPPLAPRFLSSLAHLVKVNSITIKRNRFQSIWQGGVHHKPAHLHYLRWKILPHPYYESDFFVGPYSVFLPLIIISIFSCKGIWCTHGLTSRLCRGLYCPFTVFPQCFESSSASIKFCIRLMCFSWVRLLKISCTYSLNNWISTTNFFGRYHPNSLIIAGASGKVMCRHYCMVSLFFLKTIMPMISIMNFILHVRDGCYVQRSYDN